MVGPTQTCRESGYEAAPTGRIWPRKTVLVSWLFLLPGTVVVTSITSRNVKHAPHCAPGLQLCRSRLFQVFLLVHLGYEDAVHKGWDNPQKNVKGERVNARNFLNKLKKARSVKCCARVVDRICLCVLSLLVHWEGQRLARLPAVSCCTACTAAAVKLVTMIHVVEIR